MQRNLIIALIGVIFIIIFALQNSHNIIVKFWFWEIEKPASLTITIIFFLGALLGILFSLPTILKLRKKIEILQEEKEYKEITPEKD